MSESGEPSTKLGQLQALEPTGLRELWIFVDAIRARGVRWATRALFRRFVFSRQEAFLCWDPLTPPAEAARPDPGITLRLAGPQDLEDLRAFEPYVVRARFRDWLERDDAWVVVAFDGERLVGFRCNTTRPPRDPSLPPVALEPHQVWTPEIYVSPDYRRRHVSLWLRTYADHLLHARGFSERVSRIDAENYPQLKRKLTTLTPATRLHHVRTVCALGLRWRRVDRDGRRALARLVSEIEGVRVPARSSRAE